jgi:hypothetical protein
MMEDACQNFNVLSLAALLGNSMKPVALDAISGNVMNM